MNFDLVEDYGLSWPICETELPVVVALQHFSVTSSISLSKSETERDREREGGGERGRERGREREGEIRRERQSLELNVLALLASKPLDTIS